jgi:hypothetical protein
MPEIQTGPFATTPSSTTLHNGTFERAMQILSFTSQLPSYPALRGPYTLRTSRRRDGEASSRGSSGTQKPRSGSENRGHGDWRSGAKSGAFSDSAWCYSFRVLIPPGPHSVQSASQQGAEHYKINVLWTLSCCATLKAPPTEDPSGSPRRSNPGCCDSGRSAGKVPCSHPCTAS